MSSITISIPDDEFATLRELAAQSGVPPEELLRTRVVEWLGRPDQEFARAAEYVLRKNAELYRRLA